MRLGIDFGTCYSSAAILLDGKKPQLVREPLKHGYSFPSCVYLTQDGKILVGQAAENQHILHPERYRAEFKRDLGSIDPYILGNQPFLPEELATEVIRKLKNEADEMVRSLGNASITNAVITVPATYRANKRELMEKAGKAAGFNEVQLLEEPVAAALYYAQQYKLSEGEIILVYDLGAGTFDATLLQKQGSSYQILAAPVGLSHCGGMDFDREIYQDLLEHCSESLRERLDPHNRTKEAFQARAIVGDLCRTLKHQLTEAQEAEILIPVTMESYHLTRQNVNQMIAPLIEETLESCHQLVRNAGINWEQVNQVLLVGGSCRIPYVKKTVEKELNCHPLLVDDPELAVCLGATISDGTPSPKAEPVPSHKEIIEAHINLGDSLYQQGRLEEAIAKYKEVVRLDSNNTVARRKLEIAEQTLKERSEAESKQREDEERQRIERARLEAERQARMEAERKLREKEEQERQSLEKQKEVETNPKSPNPVDRKPKGKFGECIQTLKAHSGWYAGIQSVSFSADGTMIASGSDDKTIKVWNVLTGQENYTLQGYTNCVKSVAFSPDGQFLAGGSIGLIKIWHTSNHREIISLKGHNDWIHCLVFSPDGQFLASSSADKTIRIWSVKEWRELYQLKGHKGGIYSIAFHPNGRNLISGSLDKTLKLWDVQYGKELQTIQGHSNAVYAVAFSPDGRYFASGSLDKTCKVWHESTGQEYLTLRGHSELVYTLAFSPTEPYLASGSVDQTIKLWRISDGQHLWTLQGHNHRIQSLAFSPDGEILASGSDDKTVKLWQIGRL